MSDQHQVIVQANQSQESELNAAPDIKETAPALHDEVLVDVETANGRLVLKKTARSGMVAIQYNE